jgi:hypothetical protein
MYCLQNESLCVHMLSLLEGHSAQPIHGISDVRHIRGLDTLPGGTRIGEGQA